MDSAEQAALSESEHDGPSQPQSLTKRHYEAQSLARLVADDHSDGHASRKHQRDVAAVQAKPMRRFDKQSVNLGASSIMLPDGVDVNGKRFWMIYELFHLNNMLLIYIHQRRWSPIVRCVVFASGPTFHQQSGAWRRPLLAILWLFQWISTTLPECAVAARGRQGIPTCARLPVRRLVCSGSIVAKGHCTCTTTNV